MADTGGNSYVLHDTAIIRAALEKEQNCCKGIIGSRKIIKRRSTI